LERNIGRRWFGRNFNVTRTRRAYVFHFRNFAGKEEGRFYPGLCSKIMREDVKRLLKKLEYAIKMG
jgi:hypothetical protein